MGLLTHFLDAHQPQGLRIAMVMSQIIRSTAPHQVIVDYLISCNPRLPVPVRKHCKTIILRFIMEIWNHIAMICWCSRSFCLSHIQKPFLIRYTRQFLHLQPSVAPVCPPPRPSLPQQKDRVRTSLPEQPRTPKLRRRRRRRKLCVFFTARFAKSQSTLRPSSKLTIAVRQSFLHFPLQRS